MYSFFSKASAAFLLQTFKIPTVIYQIWRTISYRGVRGSDDVCKCQVVLGKISSVTIYLKKKRKYLHSESIQTHAGKDGPTN